MSIIALFLTLLALSSLADIVWILLLSRLVGGFAHPKTLSDFETASSLENVTVIVPMRNELENVNRCLPPLLSDPGVSKIIVVDDNSTDGTTDATTRFGAIDERVQVLQAAKLNGGVSGKSNACYQGALNAESEWLLFIDADTFLSSHTVSRALNLALSKRLDAVTCLGELRCRNIWDKIAVPFYFGLLNSFIRFGGEKNDSSYFIGSFVLIKRAEYFRIGGHAAVAGELVEDKALSDLAHKFGLRFEMIYAPRLVSTEWAPGFKNGTRALSRETLPQMVRRPLSSVAFTVGLTLLFLLPLVSLISYFSSATPFRSEFLLVGTLSVSLQVIMSAYAGRVMQLEKYYLYCFPFLLPEFVFLVTMWINVIKIYTTPEISWRGRTYNMDLLQNNVRSLQNVRDSRSRMRQCSST